MDMAKIVKDTENKMQHAVDNLHTNFAGVRTGRANSMVLDRVQVLYYGTKTPINQMAAIKTPDAHLLVIEPWDKSSLKAIEAAIVEADLGLTPSNDGVCIRLPFPSLTEERRRELVKQCKALCEEAKVQVRNARRDGNNAADRLVKDESLPEDDAKHTQSEIQKLTDKFVANIDAAFKDKESQLMEI